jgi:hypothetical protein|mmetsp:Transcript_6052/g.11257  ORF Transcript_6052/g.11257 Transcript_6052/m.11257 type:complete len:253 (+) Transcript_6052:1542-2300(+)
MAVDPVCCHVPPSLRGRRGSGFRGPSREFAVLFRLIVALQAWKGLLVRGISNAPKAVRSFQPTAAPHSWVSRIFSWVCDRDSVIRSITRADWKRIESTGLFICPLPLCAAPQPRSLLRACIRGAPPAAAFGHSVILRSFVQSAPALFLWRLNEFAALGLHLHTAAPIARTLYRPSLSAKPARFTCGSCNGQSHPSRGQLHGSVARLQRVSEVSWSGTAVVRGVTPCCSRSCSHMIPPGCWQPKNEQNGHVGA